MIELVIAALIHLGTLTTTPKEPTTPPTTQGTTTEGFGGTGAWDDGN